MNRDTIPKVTNTLWDQCFPPDYGYQTRAKSQLTKAKMDLGVAGPVIIPVPEGYAFNTTEITDYIVMVLKHFAIENSYGILAAVENTLAEITPTVILGLPGVTIVSSSIPQPPTGIGLLVRDDCMLAVNDCQNTWAAEPVRNLDQLVLDPCSIGLEGSVLEAGSFGGFLQQRLVPERIFGITAAHCVPGGLAGNPICSPSTAEVTGRFARLLRYSSLSTMVDRLRIVPGRDHEAQAIVNQYSFSHSSTGQTFLHPSNQTQARTGVFSGARLGSIVYCHFGVHSDLLHRYDQELSRKGLPSFSARISWLTRVDYCIFTCDHERYGGNIYQDELVSEVGDLYPGAVVEKVGRTSGTTHGTVSRAVLVIWAQGSPTFEIGIIGRRCDIFARVGDSGGCVFENEGGTYKAAGLIIGKNLPGDITYATPLRLLLQTYGDYQWAT